MGHGLTALVLGCGFEKLVIHNGGGFALISYPSNLVLSQNITQALVALGGLLGPCVFGILLIILAKNNRSAKYTLTSLVALLIISILIWVRSVMGISILGVITGILLIILVTKNSSLIQWTLLFLGTQCVLSTYLQIDYLFTGTFYRDGKEMNSDTQVIANNLFGTYWFWAILIMIISFLILRKGYKYYLK